MALAQALGGALLVPQERGDVDLVVADLERRALAIVDDGVAVGRLARGASRSRGAAAAARRVVEAGRDDRDAHLVAERLVDDRAEDDVRVGVGGAVDDLGRLVDLEQAEVARRR